MSRLEMATLEINTTCKLLILMESVFEIAEENRKDGPNVEALSESLLIHSILFIGVLDFILILDSVCQYIVGISFLFYQIDSESAKYLLSSLVGSESAILALIITMSLIAVQLAASSYSARVIDEFKRTPAFWILIGIYIFVIFYMITVLKLIEKNY